MRKARKRGPFSLLERLRHSVGVVDEEHRDLLVRLLADIDTSVNLVRGLIPICLPRRDLEPMALTAIAVFDGEGIAPQDHRHPMKWVAMPVHGFAGCEAHPPDEGCSALEEPFLSHW